MLTELINVIAPVFVCAAIGFIWKRQGRPFDIDLISTIAVYIGTPCLAFYTLTSANLDPDSFNIMALAAVVTMVAFVVLYVPILKIGTLRFFFAHSLSHENTYVNKM